MSRTNEVTLFSNGIGHFRRSYLVPAKKELNISIPFKRDHIGDVATSIQVFGKVRRVATSYTPNNANDTELKVDQNDALKSLLSSLSGSQVTVKFTNSTEKVYTLLGLDSDESFLDGVETRKEYVALMADGSVKRKPLSEIEDIAFNDEGVRTEIQKAIKNNFQKIKPDSTMFDVVLSTTTDTDQEAVIQYTIPVAAWKMRYAIRQEGDAFSLEGSAIIDNNTDEDWDNVKVSVVTGNPISFSTDIANVVMPNRKFISVVDAQNLENVNVEEACAEQNYGLESVQASSRSYSKRNFGPKMSVSNYTQFGLESTSGADAENDFGGVAESAGVDSKEIGDFCLFTSKEPITILARKSAVVPMFTMSLKRAGIVLLYKESNHSRRPFRAVKFKNDSEYYLGKGKTVVYNNGLFSGECVLEATKPSENRMLPHCLENGVKIVKESKPIETRRTSIRISEGVGVTEDVYTAVTTYELENKKDEVFSMSVEHMHVLSGYANLNVDFDGVEVKEREKLASNNGHRVYFSLEPKQKVTLTVVETSLNNVRQNIANHYPWLVTTIIKTNNPLSKDKQVVVCIDIQKEIDDLCFKLGESKTRREELNEQVQRVRENLAATKDMNNSSTVNKWITDLDATENEIRNIDKKEVPDLNNKIKSLQSKLRDELSKMVVSWKS